MVVDSSPVRSIMNASEGGWIRVSGLPSARSAQRIMAIRPRYICTWRQNGRRGPKRAITSTGTARSASAPARSAGGLPVISRRLRPARRAGPTTRRRDAAATSARDTAAGTAAFPVSAKRAAFQTARRRDAAATSARATAAGTAAFPDSAKRRHISVAKRYDCERRWLDESW